MILDTTMLEQNKIRIEKRKLRNLISDSSKLEKSNHIYNKVTQLPEYKKAKRIACYLSLPEEVCVNKIIESAWQENKEVYLPVIVGKEKPLAFAIYHPDTKLTKGVLNINIPVVDKITDYISASDLEFIVTPLVAFDESRNRIGMGGGFYDRTFAFVKDQPSSTTFLAAVAFSEQKTSKKIVANPWDIKPNLIVTD